MTCSIGCAKCLIIVFNIVYAILGIALASLGVIFRTENLEYSTDVVEVISGVDQFRALRLLSAILFLVSGLVIILFSFFGSCAAIKESTCLLKTFAIILTVFCIVQIGISAFAFTASNNAGSIHDYRPGMQKVFDHYDNNTDVRSAFDYFQKEYSCCGVQNYEDYNGIDQNIPPSCCHDSKGACYRYDLEHLHQAGCAEKQVEKVSFFLKTIGAISTVVAVLEVIGAILAYYLANTIRNELRRGACT